MFTLQHGFWIYFFSRKHRQVWQFVAGSMLPDYVYIVLLVIMLGKGQLYWKELASVSPQVLMSYLPLYPWVIKIDLIGHSVVSWAIAFLVSLLPVFNRAQAFVIGWGTHIFIDALTHGAYANYFLYPLSMYAVHSPVSYWETQYFAHEFRIVNTGLIILTASYLVYRWLYKKYKK